VVRQERTRHDRPRRRAAEQLHEIAKTAQYTKVSAVEHIYPLVRTQKQLDRVLAEIEESPGIVLYLEVAARLLLRRPAA
jgi:regulator of PEP synthase PpsR (kinase-PPPase family)